jgi:dTDP-4-amino-4,6-dideoxygalactose transaminase
MIPRYLPRPDVRRWFTSLRRGDQPIHTDELAFALVGDTEFTHGLAASRLRDALYVWFRDIRTKIGRGTVLMSAQICPVVPRAAIAAGLLPRFADIAPDRPTSGPQELAAAIDVDTIAVIVAPQYGHLHRDWADLIEHIGPRALLIDMAQGLGISLPAGLRARADAIGYSFGVGKGLDTGGGVLLSRGRLPPPEGAPRRMFWLPAFAQCMTIRALSVSGLFGVVASRLAAEAQADPASFHADNRPIDWPGATRVWMSQLPGYIAAVAQARTRATTIASIAAASGRFRNTDTHASADATHLRQILQLVDPHDRLRTIDCLRHAGVDCAPAGERPPWTYLPDIDPAAFPNTADFIASAIRLPFTGRLTVPALGALCVALEAALVPSLR